MPRTVPRWRRLRLAVAALAVTAIAGGLAAPSVAAPRDRGRHPVHHGYRRPPPAYGYGVPTYVPAPPPLVYSPPAYASPFSLGLSFNIR